MIANTMSHFQLVAGLWEPQDRNFTGAGERETKVSCVALLVLLSSKEQLLLL